MPDFDPNEPNDPDDDGTQFPKRLQWFLEDTENPYNGLTREISFFCWQARAVIALAELKRRAGNTGEFVHRNDQERNDYDYEPCPFCGCQSWFAFCGNGTKIGASDHSDLDDVFECAYCFATNTRRDAMDPEHARQVEAEIKAGQTTTPPTRPRRRRR